MAVQPEGSAHCYRGSSIDACLALAALLDFCLQMSPSARISEVGEQHWGVAAHCRGRDRDCCSSLATHHQRKQHQHRRVIAGEWFARFGWNLRRPPRAPAERPPPPPRSRLLVLVVRSRHHLLFAIIPSLRHHMIIIYLSLCVHGAACVREI